MLLKKNIIKKYLTALGEEQTQKPWELYQAYFLDEDIQANIHKIKEEQFQKGYFFSECVAECKNNRQRSRLQTKKSTSACSTYTRLRKNAVS